MSPPQAPQSPRLRGASTNCRERGNGYGEPAPAYCVSCPGGIFTAARFQLQSGSVGAAGGGYVHFDVGNRNKLRREDDADRLDYRQELLTVQPCGGAAGVDGQQGHAASLRGRSDDGG